MSQNFLYFLPGIPRTAALPSAAEIAARGLSYAFEGRPTGRGCVGPAGQEGMLLGCPRRWESGNVYYEPTQIWQPHPQGQYFVGYWPGQLPGPTELAREKLLDGHPLVMADDRSWQIPLARDVHDECQPNQFRCTWSCELPQRVALDAQGHWREQGPLTRYQPLWELVSGWNDYRRGTDDDPGWQELVEHWSQYQTRFAAATEVLAANYVVGPVECSILGLFTRDNAREVLDLAIAQPEFEVILKKYVAAIRQAQSTAAAAGSTSSPGPVAENNPITPTSLT